MTIHFGDSTSIATATGLGAKLVNVAQTFKTDQFSASQAHSGFGNNCIELVYAASSSSNRLLVWANLCIGYQHGQSVIMRFSISGSDVSGTVANAHESRLRGTAASYLDSAYQISNMTANFIKTSPSTSNVTYGCQLAHTDNATQTVYLNRSSNNNNQSWRPLGTSSLTIIEYVP